MTETMRDLHRLRPCAACARNCRRPRWLPAWGWLHCWSCADSTPNVGSS